MSNARCRVTVTTYDWWLKNIIVMRSTKNTVKHYDTKIRSQVGIVLTKVRYYWLHYRSALQNILHILLKLAMIFEQYFCPSAPIPDAKT